MKKEQYKKIFEEYMQPSDEKIFGKKNYFIFQHDNDPKHTSRIIKKYLDKQHFYTMEWPDQSPDLNPIENLWHILDRILANRKCSSIEQLFLVLKDAWENLDKNILINLVQSMPKRCQA